MRNMRAGNKVYCINEHPFFKEGDTYTISSIQEEDNELTIIDVINKQFDEFFYTEKELRKLKLNEIKNRG